MKFYLWLLFLSFLLLLENITFILRKKIIILPETSYLEFKYFESTLTFTELLQNKNFQTIILSIQPAKSWTAITETDLQAVRTVHLTELQLIKVKRQATLQFIDTKIFIKSSPKQSITVWTLRHCQFDLAEEAKSKPILCHHPLPQFPQAEIQLVWAQRPSEHTANSTKGKAKPCTAPPALQGHSRQCPFYHNIPAVTIRQCIWNNVVMLLSQKKITHHPNFAFSMIRPENSQQGRRTSHLHSFCQWSDMERPKIQASLGLKKIRGAMLILQPSSWSIQQGKSRDDTNGLKQAPFC